MDKNIRIREHIISYDTPTYVIAEMSANHNMDLNRAKEIIDATAEAGADAVKLQTYTADTITIDCNTEYFKTRKGLWEGMTLHQLYEKAYTPWEWQAELKEYAEHRGVDLFSSPFDLTAVDFLEDLNMPAYKVASFEINDIPLIRKIAKTGKPIIISTGIAYLEDIELALKVCKEEKNEQVILLKCISAYPAPFENMNLKVLTDMGEKFDCICGLSDHTLGSEVSLASVALGAKVIEKHITLKRSDGGQDSAFSMEPEEFKNMVSQIRNVEKALGKVSYELSEKQIDGRRMSRSLFVVEDVKAGEIFSEKNVRSIRPGYGLHTKYWEEILGKKAACDISRGTPMDWKYIK